MKFVEENHDFSRFGLKTLISKVWIKILLRKFHPRKNLKKKLLSSNLGSRNTMKTFLGHKNIALGLKLQKRPKPLLVTTLRSPSFKILSMQDIKLAQMPGGTKISAL